MSSGKRGLKRLEELNIEVERINKKLDMAQEFGLNEEDLGVVIRRLEELHDLIGDAAKEEARREINCAKKEARRIRDGRKKPGGNHPGNDDDEPDDKDDPDDPDGGDGGDDEKCCCCCKCTPAAAPSPASGSSVPDATCVYVQTETTVAAWDRGQQRWEVFDAQSAIVKVTFISGGILVVGKDKAAIFDCKIGLWLKAFDPSGSLIDGAGQ
ncbi:MAG: hypothetical protein GKR94_33835 [Gammaproteobacteria bacterium]|nr:hypothetical protein [Gammaproteobacteria bacterium]